MKGPVDWKNLFGGKSKKNSEENSETSTRLSDNRHRPRCCASATSGHPTAAPPRSVMKSRRRISAPKLTGQHCVGSNEYFDSGRNRHQNHCRSAQPMSEMGHGQPKTIRPS
jgi:hypothetical protein